jgi:hypothetical protein
VHLRFGLSRGTKITTKNTLDCGNFLKVVLEKSRSLVKKWWLQTNVHYTVAFQKTSAKLKPTFPFFSHSPTCFPSNLSLSKPLSLNVNPSLRKPHRRTPPLETTSPLPAKLWFLILVFMIWGFLIYLLLLNRHVFDWETWWLQPFNLTGIIGCSLPWMCQEVSSTFTIRLHIGTHLDALSLPTRAENESSETHLTLTR